MVLKGTCEFSRRARCITNIRFPGKSSRYAAYRPGPAVLPGNYTVKLDVGGQSYRQSLVVKMDPRVNTPADELAAATLAGFADCNAVLQPTTI